MQPDFFNIVLNAFFNAIRALPLWLTAFIIIILLFSVLIKTRWFKGVFGEFIVNVTLRFSLNSHQYSILKNVTLPTDNGSTQIDHIVISQYGIFVIETKNMKGWIFGSEHQKQWTQQIYKHKNKFQNPLHQNYKHTQTLKILLDLEQEQIISMVVFVGSAKFKTKIPNNVTNVSGLISLIKSYSNISLNDVQLNSVFDSIQGNRFTSSHQTNKKHIAHVKEIIANKNKF